MTKSNSINLQVVRLRDNAPARNGLGTAEADPTGRNRQRVIAAAVAAVVVVVRFLSPQPQLVGTRLPQPTATIGLTPAPDRRNRRTRVTHHRTR
jgi:hypothetical protein